MKLRTELPTLRAAFDINHQISTLGIGSCFVENIGDKMEKRRFPFHQNPFGIVYNPLSIAAQLDVLMTQKKFVESDLAEINGLYHSWLHHGAFSEETVEGTLNGINSAIDKARLFLKTTNRLFLTFGSATVYQLKTTQEVVANCHKAPPPYFDRRRLSTTEIVAAFLPVFEKLSAQSVDLQIILTVSPIRHLRDGLIENNLSKATLLLAADELAQKFPNVTYFPAYELVMDDLRDYRFFERDMMHPTAQAVDYIWDYFSHTYFSEATRNVIREVEKINAMQAHRPINGQDTEGVKKFQQTLALKIKDLEKRFPFLDHRLDRLD
jgi:GSCFA family